MNYMNYKIIAALIVAIVISAIFITAGRTHNNSFEKIDNPLPVEAEKTVGQTDTFVPIIASENTSATDEDVLISAQKASSRAGDRRRKMD